MAAKKSRKPKEPLAHTRTFVCALCPSDLPAFETPAAYVGHVKECHPELLDSAGRLLARKHGKVFLDGEGFYSNVFEWQQNGQVVCRENASGPRGGF